MNLFKNHQSEAESAARELLLNGENLKELRLVTIVRTGSKEYEQLRTDGFLRLSSFKLENTNFCIFAR